MRFFVSVIISIILAGCAPDAERAQADRAVGEEVEAINGLMAAFNAHDADKMRDYWHNDVTWVEVTGNQTSVVTSSADQLHQELVVYFEQFPTAQSSLENIATNGKYVMAVERPVWQEAGERKSQSSNVVYEVVDGKVKRFWYFPPQQEIAS